MLFEAEIIGYIAGFLTTICTLPQLWKIISKKSAQDVSLLTYIILICGQMLWIIYGTYANDLRIIVTNVISCIIVTFVVIFGFIYKLN